MLDRDLTPDDYWEDEIIIEDDYIESDLLFSEPADSIFDIFK